MHWNFGAHRIPSEKEIAIPSSLVENAGKMKVRLTKEQKIKIANSDDIAEIMQKILLRENRLSRKQERFWVVGLSTKNQIEFIELIGLGSINKVVVGGFEVFSLASARKTPNVILVHNHPSGDTKPSKGDKEFTKNLIQSGDILRVRVLDHIIITEEDYFSFTDKGLIPATTNS